LTFEVTSCPYPIFILSWIQRERKRAAHSLANPWVVAVSLVSKAPVPILSVFEDNLKGAM